MNCMAAPASPTPNWWTVPAPVLASIFRLVLENYDTLEDISKQWINLATVCQAWLRAARLTPLYLHVAAPTHLANPHVRTWMSKNTLEVLVVNRTAAVEHQMAAEAEVSLFDCDLLSRPETATNSGLTLVALINASLGAAPLLHPFTNLRQLSLFSPVLPAPAEPEIVDVAALAPLTQLTCLVLAGHMTVPDCAALPVSLKHLSLSLHHRHQSINYKTDLNNGLFFSGEAQTVSLPLYLTDLEFLSLKANYLVVSWGDLVTRCREIHLSANYLGITTAGGQLHDPRMFIETLAATQTVECVVMAFHRLGLFPPSVPPPQDLRPSDGDVDLGEFLVTLREGVLATWDMDPIMDAPAGFVNDSAPFDECFCLTLERQEPGQPRSYHFTPLLTDAEVELLRQRPAWRLVWCRDPRTAEVLADPQFVAANAPHLVRLSRCMLPDSVDLRPFTALRSLHCELGGAVQSVRFPLGLTCLELEVPQRAVEDLNNEEADDLHLLERRTFSASALGPLRALRDLALTGWHRHDLATLGSHVTSIRLTNPLMETPEGFVESLGEEALRMPRALNSTASLAARTDAEDEEAATVLAEEMETAAFAEVAVNAQQPRPRRRRMLHHDNDLDQLAHLSYVMADHDDGLYDNSVAEMDHSPCTDPSCPVHSGKPHLHITFSDARTEIPIDLLSLVRSGFPMLSITVNPVQQAAHAGVKLYLGVGTSWQDFVQVLRDSKIQRLEINHRQNGGMWGATVGALRLCSLWEGFQALQAELGDVFEFKTWDGEATRPGLVPQGAGYALIRILERED